MMVYYTLATKKHEVYGHGDSGEEYHILPIDSYHTESKKYHPLFKDRRSAENYKNNLTFNFRMEVVELQTHE